MSVIAVTHYSCEQFFLSHLLASQNRVIYCSTFVKCHDFEKPMNESESVRLTNEWLSADN